MNNVVKVALCAFLWLLAGIASAQTSVSGFDSMMNKIIRGTPGVTNVAIGTGIRTTATDAVAVSARGLVIPVATTVAADVGYGAVAAGAARVAVRAVPWVGTALVLGDIASAVKGSGYTTCAPPAFFCKPAVAAPTGGTAIVTYTMSGGAGSYSNDDPGAACSGYVAKRAALAQPNGDMVPYSMDSISGTAPTITCNFHSDAVTSPPYKQAWSYSSFAVVMATAFRCADGTSVSSYTGCPVAGTPGQVVPATADDINAQLAAKINADHDWGVAMKAKMDAINAQNPALEPVIDVTTAPVTVTAAPVTSPATVVSTEQISNPDGTTSTKTIKETTTVTPTQTSSGTVARPNVNYPSTTTQTTTITNNTTNQSTTTVTNITNPVAAPAPVKQADLPTDYNREATQQKILDSLTTPITDTPPDGANDLKSVKDQNDAGSNAVTNITEGSTGLKSWLPTIKTAQCVNPQVPTPITGGMLAVPICDSVDIFAKFISAVISVFALYGCIREVQAAMKA